MFYYEKIQNFYWPDFHENWLTISIMAVETNMLICSVNQWTGFCKIGASVMKELKE